MAKRRPRPEARTIQREGTAEVSPQAAPAQRPARDRSSGPEASRPEPVRPLPKPAPKRRSVLLLLAAVMLGWYGFLIFAALRG